MRKAGSATVIVAAHHAREAALADRIVRLDARPTMDGDYIGDRMRRPEAATAG